jgi:elongation factor G
MALISIEKLRNVLLLSGSNTGKTALGESILFLTGNGDKPGKPGDKSSQLAIEEEEIERRATLGVSIASVDWKGYRFNFLDTPGVSAFHFDTKNALRIADSALFVVSAVDNLRIDSTRLWRSAEESALPVIFFVNKLDRENASLPDTIAVIEKELGIKPLVLHLPIGKESKFRGVVDLLTQKAFIYGENPRKENETEIPSEVKEESEEYRKKLIESLAEVDDATLEKYLNGETLTDDELLGNLKKGILNRKLFPLFCGSAQTIVGLTLLLDMLSIILPPPSELHDVKGISPADGSEILRKQSREEAFSAWVFRTIIDPFVGKISYARIFSGTLNSDTQVLNSTKNLKEKIGTIYLVKGKKQEQKDSCGAGEIVAFTKLKETSTGDTLCAEKSPVVFKFMSIPNPVLSFSIKPKTKADEDKLAGSVAKILEEDPSLQIQRDQQTKETVLSGCSQDQIEFAVKKLKRKFATDVEIALPKVPYKETIKGKSRVQGKYKKQSGGRGQYGDCWLEVEPLPRGKGYEFIDKIVGGVIPRQFIPSVEKGVKEAIQKGVLAGYPVIDIRISLVDGSYHVVDSSDIAFKIAGAMALRKALQEAKPVLLEPIMSIEVTVPEDCVGDIIGDLNSRRGKILGVDGGGSEQIVRAHVPLAEVLMYAQDLKSITQGRGSFSMEFYTYNEVPAQLAEKIIQSHKQELAEEGEPASA